MTKKVEEDLGLIRREIDALDKLLLETLKKRTKLITKVAKIKLKHDLPLYQKARWSAMLLERISLAKKLDLSPDFVTALYKLIHRESIRLQGLIRNEDKK